MFYDTYITVADCQSWVGLGTRSRHQKQLRLSPAAGPLECLGMGIRGLFSKNKSGNEYVIVLTAL